MPPAKIIKTKARGRRAEKIRQNLHKAVLTKASHKLKKNYHEISPPQSHNSLKKCILVFLNGFFLGYFLNFLGHNFAFFSREGLFFSRAQFCCFFLGHNFFSRAVFQDFFSASLKTSRAEY